MSSGRLCPDCNKYYDMQLIRCPHCGYDPFKAAAESFAHNRPSSDVDVIALLMDRINHARKTRHGVYAAVMEDALYEIKSLRAQVEELSKYPKAAVTAVYLAGVHSGECNAVGVRHILDSDQIKAIFEEKRGVGK